MKLYKFQRDGVIKLDQFNGLALIADDTGLGKTIQCLAYIKKKNIERTLVVCPAIAKWHWQREAKLHIGLRSCVLQGETPHVSLLNKAITIINYDILQYWAKT